MGELPGILPLWLQASVNFEWFWVTFQRVPFHLTLFCSERHAQFGHTFGAGGKNWQSVEGLSSACEAVNCDGSHLTTLTTSCRIHKSIHFTKASPIPSWNLPICIKSTRCRLPGLRTALVLRHVKCHLQIVNGRRLDNRQCSPVNRKRFPHRYWFIAHPKKIPIDTHPSMQQSHLSLFAQESWEFLWKPRVFQVDCGVERS